jgi:hypothetical protein
VADVDENCVVVGGEGFGEVVELLGVTWELGSFEIGGFE